MAFCRILKVQPEEERRKTTRISVSSRKSTKCQNVTKATVKQASNTRSCTVTNKPKVTKRATLTKSAVEEPTKKRSSSGINVGTWNVRTLRTEGHWEILLDEVRRFGLDILGLCETHLTESETLINKDEYTILLAGRKDGIGREGVGLLISQPLLECLVSYESVSSRILTAKFKMKEGILNIINVYAPTTAHSDAESDEFYDGLQHHLQNVNKKEKLILMGDFNAKIGSDSKAWTPAMGKYGIADVGSDHNLVIAKVVSAPVRTKRLKTTPKSYDVSRFINPLIAEEFRAKIGGTFEPLLQLEDTDVEDLWAKFRDTTNKITEESVGIRRARQVKGLPEEGKQSTAE
ncbi:uncharacterized protein [Amphiura filiformis]|uniref:uncharacterized protein n=1 Tax=Amphiura filiformis TaxID=82378 RepID=UPI003B20D17E